jgi:Ca2+/Na+ antiporter
MRSNTQLLFQLLLSIFTIYSMLENIINYHLLVPLFCLVAMYFVGRYEGERRQKSIEQVHNQLKELATA